MRFKILAVGFIFALNASCSSLPNKGGDETHPHDEDELLVLDPPADYLRHLPDLGLEVIDVTHLPGIGGNLYHLRIKDGAHHHFEHHAVKADKNYTPRAAPGVIAYVAAAQRKLGLMTVGEIRAHLRKHTKDRGKPGRDRYTGWGLLELPPLCRADA